MEMDLINKFKEDCRLRGLSKDSCSTYPCQAKLFLGYLEDTLQKGPITVDKNDLIQYLKYLREEKHLKQSSIERAFTVLTTFYDFLEEDGLVSANPVKAMRKRYLRSYKNANESQKRKLISIEEASILVNSILDTRDRAIVILLLKTGVRRHELTDLDIDDVDMDNMTIQLKPTAKRSNREVYFDSEAAEALGRWLRAREVRNKNGSPALFISRRGGRLAANMVQIMVVKYSISVGLCNIDSKKQEDRFTPHCCRHWFTTHLIRAGMPRDFVKELRGDVRREAIDIYNHIDKKELQESYLAHIPQLGI
ncbi:MAG: tyrosine-type recombinase/integrase [Methanotrichaceae archaeon]|nr:tyrosine-type recombinase/integrase [Methanotrichaceae archaeon]